MRLKMSINENTTLESILESSYGTITVLARHGLHSISCPSELYLPIKVVAESREIPVERLLEDLQKVIGENQA